MTEDDRTEKRPFWEGPYAVLQWLMAGIDPIGFELVFWLGSGLRI